jgi:FtsP/CotA-like multicopper oxidase with cupredoxin domain
VVRQAEAVRRKKSTGTVTAALNPRPVTLDLGGRTVETWGYAEQAPGPLIRAKVGDVLRVDVHNQLPVATSVHWHGVALRNDMDGVPGLTQSPIAPGATFRYEFTAPDPGTYFYHPHSGVQLDRALYGVLVVDDPDDPGRYDVEWTVVLDDWVDGTGRTPEQVLASLRSMGGTGMRGAGMGGMEMNTSPLLGDAGDISYPYYLVNGRAPAAPVTLTGRPRQRARVRIVNAAADTAFRVALGGHRLTVTHTDGYPVLPSTVDAVLVAMGERVDVVVDLGDGAFPLVALAEGKRAPGGGQARAFAVVRTGAGAAPAPGTRPSQLDGALAQATDLRATDAVRLPDRGPDRAYTLTLAGGMMPYRWTVNGVTFDKAEPVLVKRGERIRLRFVNTSRMFHPMHLHGHTFGLPGGPRKDTVVVKPDQTVAVELDATNPGQWMAHCHNAYHAETGMMVNLAYRA